MWLIAAVLRPEATYYSAPMLVAGAPSVVVVLDGVTVPGNQLLVVAAGVGSLVAVAVTGVLTVMGWLRGPPLGSFDSAVGESLAAARLGGSGRVPRRRAVAPRPRCSPWPLLMGN